MGVFGQTVRMSSAGELGCTYAALILQDEDIAITEDKVKALLNAANVEYESYWPGLFCKVLVDNENVGKLLAKPSGGGGGCAEAAPGAAGGDAGAAAAPEEESDEEEDAGPVGVGLFGG